MADRSTHGIFIFKGFLESLEVVFRNHPLPEADKRCGRCQVPNHSREKENNSNTTEMKHLEKSNFKRLIGVWTTTGIIKAEEGNLELIGIDSYEWILAGNFMLHKADVKMGNVRSETLEIIKPGASSDNAIMQYFNTQGEEGRMLSSIVNNEFKIEGNGLKFIGSINDENTEISGKWYNQAENEKWLEFINLRLEKHLMK